MTIIIIVIITIIIIVIVIVIIIVIVIQLVGPPNQLKSNPYITPIIPVVSI